MEEHLEKILEDNLRDFIDKEVNKIIEKATNDFERELKNNKDHYIEHLMKNIRVLHEYNHNENRIDYKIIFVNEYQIKECDKDD